MLKITSGFDKYTPSPKDAQKKHGFADYYPFLQLAAVSTAVTMINK